METLPLPFRLGHYFVEIAGALWVFDTGATTSFGDRPVTIAGKLFPVLNNVMGITAQEIAGHVGVHCDGLLGADVLNQFDMIIDAPSGRITFSNEQLDHAGETVPLDMFMGVPFVSARIRGRDHRMCFDTGAKISYFQGDSLSQFPAVGEVSDFYPGLPEEFTTETYHVELSIGALHFVLRCGALPEELGELLRRVKGEGIVGNEILANRVVGYFPRRRLLVL